MRVITGIARGKRLETLKGDDVRPTSDRIKEALFSIIQFRLEGRSFLDLFAGCGQIGIEALSRGAKEAVFVDKNKRSIDVIKYNLKNTHLEQNAKVLNMDSVNFLTMKSQTFDIAYIDPPYNKGLLEKVMPLMPQNMNKGGIIICECTTDEKLGTEYGDFVFVKEYRYSKIKLTTFCHKDAI